ncbi:MAG: TIGR02588 family protein [Elainellaceae cyanobacterium]
MQKPAPPSTPLPQDAIAPPQKSSPKSSQAGRSLAEWITLCASMLVLFSLIGLVLYDWQVSQNRPPAFRVEITESARVTEGHYYVPFSITNTGGRIARTVQVTAELQLDEATETGEQQIDFLSGNERKHGSFVFSHNPQDGALMIRVASYRLP